MARFRILGTAAFALIGCGRVGFDASSDGGADTASDVPLDVALRAFEDLATSPPGGLVRTELGLSTSPANTSAETAFCDTWIVAAGDIGCP